MTSSDRVRQLCKERRIPVSKVERDLGYSNGYLSSLKKDLPGDRLLDLAEYFSVSPRFLVTGKETEKAPVAETGDGGVSDDDIKFALWGGKAETITDEELEEVRRFAAFIAERRRQKEGGDR